MRLFALALTALVAAAPMSVSAEDGTDRAQISRAYRAQEQALPEFDTTPLYAVRAPNFTAIGTDGEPSPSDMRPPLSADQRAKIKAKIHVVKAQYRISRVIVIGDNAVAAVAAHLRYSTLFPKTSYTEYVDNVATQIDDWHRAPNGTWQMTKTQALTNTLAVDSLQLIKTMNQIYAKANAGGGSGGGARGGGVDNGTFLRAMEARNAQSQAGYIMSDVNQAIRAINW